MFTSVLIANRGEIASRIIRTCHRLGIRALTVYSEADAEMPFVSEADEAILLGPSAPSQSYLDVDRILGAAVRLGAEAIHPGYGFLSENPEFARSVASAGLTWIGPPPNAIAAMGDKINARNLVSSYGVPVAAGTRQPIRDHDAARSAAEHLGYPVMVKASAGGGGIGMGVARNADELAACFATAHRRAAQLFGTDGILLERYVERARHIEVQLLGLADGTVCAVGDRDCSVQRRNQKVVEEAPAAALTPELRDRLYGAAIRAGESVGYRGAGTVEFLLDCASGDFYFLEMNTRLQVEHPVTEMVTGIDLVESQLRIAAGEPLDESLKQLTQRGHSIELRIYAEDPQRFLPSPGTITAWRPPSGEGIRVDAGYRVGNTVTPHYDPLLAKLCTWAPTRDHTIQLALAAAATFRVEGLKTNLSLFSDLLTTPDFLANEYDTSLIARMRAQEREQVR